MGRVRSLVAGASVGASASSVRYLMSVESPPSAAFLYMGHTSLEHAQKRPQTDMYNRGLPVPMRVGWAVRSAQFSRTRGSAYLHIKCVGAMAPALARMTQGPQCCQDRIIDWHCYDSETNHLNRMPSQQCTQVKTRGENNVKKEKVNGHFPLIMFMVRWA